MFEKRQHSGRRFQSFAEEGQSFVAKWHTFDGTGEHLQHRVRIAIELVLVRGWTDSTEYQCYVMGLGMGQDRLAMVCTEHSLSRLQLQCVDSHAKTVDPYLGLFYLDVLTAPQPKKIAVAAVFALVVFLWQLIVAILASN